MNGGTIDMGCYEFEHIDCTFADKTVTYNGANQSLVLSGIKSTDTVTYTYNGSTISSPTFQKPGTYTVKATVSRSGETKSYNATLTITPPAIWIVNTLDDATNWDTADNVLSLREAIGRAGAGDVITFDSSLSGLTITLSGTQIEIGKSVTIDATSIGGMTIDADGKSRVFYVSGGTADAPVELIGLTVTGGHVSDYGGGIYNDGMVELINSTVSGNTAEYDGGGIYNSSGVLTLTDSTVSGNTAEIDGGGIYNDDGTLTLTDSTVSGNTVYVYSGGIYNGGTLTLTNCTVTGNSATYGGGISNDDGTLTLTNSTVTGNSATSCGGGISNSGTLTLTNCTVTGNSANDSGGGIYNYDGAAYLYNTIIVQNTASSSGNDVYRYSGSLYAYNTLSPYADWKVSDACPVYDPSKPLFADAANGDYTLAVNSQAIDMGDNEYIAGYDTDLAGNPRIFDAWLKTPTVDIGAYEYQQHVAEREIPSTVVTTNLDIIDEADGLISLREAVFYAAEGETVTFDAGLTGKKIILCGTQLEIDKGITIDASSIGEITINADGKSRVFYIGGGNETNPVVLIGLTVSGGYVSGSNNGGGIYNSGVLTLTNCTVAGNTAAYGGGGICNLGTLTLTNCTVSGNTVNSFGGGIYNYSGKTYLYNTIIVQNTASSSGNDVYCSSGSFYAYNTLSSFAYWTESSDCPAYDSSLPLFADAANGDYTLAVNSQAIDMGDNSYVETETDLAGNSRIVNDIVDLGAYEYQPGDGQIKQLATPTNLTATCPAKYRFSCAWDAVDNASGYTVYYKSSSATSWTARTTTTNSFNAAGLSPNLLYSVKVVANGDGTTYTDSEESETVYALPPSYTTQVTTLSDIKATADPTGDISFRQAVYFASLTGDTVTFADGLSGTVDLATYGQISISSAAKGFTVEGDNRITLTNSGTGGANRIFFCGDTDTGYDVTLNDLTITGCSVTNDSNYYNDGGAIFAWNPNFDPDTMNTVNFILNDCTFTNNTAATRGGAISGYGYTITADNCVFSGNSANEGGAIRLVGGDVHFTDCTFTENTAIGTGNSSAQGGALDLGVYYGSTIDNCVFSNNAVKVEAPSSWLSGGGAAKGGAIYLSDNHDKDQSTDLIFTDTKIIDNTATCADGQTCCDTTRGGAIYAANAGARFYNCSITGNGAINARKVGGGAIYMIGSWGYVSSDTTLFFFMTDISDNYIGGGMIEGVGGGVAYGGALYAGGRFEMVNCTVTNNTINATRVYSYTSSSAIMVCAGVGDSKICDTTIAGNRVVNETRGSGHNDDNSALVIFDKITIKSSAILGNYYIDTVNNTRIDNDIFSHACYEEKPPAYFYSSVYNPEAIGKDAEYTEEQAWCFSDSCIQVTDYEAYFNDYAAGDYTLAFDSVGIDAVNMSEWTDFGFEYDIRGEGYCRVVNNIVDIGAYEYQRDISDLETPSTVVTTNLDIINLLDNLISLREAIYYAEEGDTVTFDSSLSGQTITLSGTQLEIDKGITIDASSIGGITINADGKSRVFYVSGGTADAPVELIGLTVTGGHVIGSIDGGGGIFNRGTLTLTNCTVTGNSAIYCSGGGIFNDDGTLTLRNCTVAGNTTNGAGGGIYISANDDIYVVAFSSAAAYLYNTIIVQNKASNSGNDVCCSTGSLYAYNTLSSFAGWTESSDCPAYDPSLPLFADAANWDYTLAVNSQAIDKGDNSYISGYSADLAGNPRIVSGTVDIGAYEYQVTSSLDITIKDYTGDYDGQAHSITVSGLQDGDVVAYSKNGTDWSSSNYAYTDPGTYTVYVKVEREGYQDFKGSGTVTINAVTEKLQVAVVVSASESSATEVDVLPDSITAAAVGDTLYAQVWIVNIDGSDLGCTGGYVDLDYTADALTADTFTVSPIYANMATFVDASVDGVVASFGGCSQTGVNDLAVSQWALLGTFTFTASVVGEAEIAAALPTLNGFHIRGLNLSRAGEGNFADSEIVFDSAVFTVTATAGGGEQLASPTITTGAKDVYVSHGANCHQLVWTAVDNASGYELEYSAGSSPWTAVSASEASVVITGLAYGQDVKYRVRALGTGSYTDSDWSAVKTFKVCPMDINGDGDISGGDRTLLANSWLSEGGEEEYRHCCDINGDGDIGGVDRAYLAYNWLNEVGVDDMIYPRPLAADVVFNEFATADLGVDLDVF
ncbi:MAG: hypothetical protein J6S40_02880 [Thermoguttaceae bacterium]|nr:hypothetical protein [Thermoguttaceae bacterium]